MWISRARRGLLYAIMAGVGALIAFPFYWMLSTSLKSNAEASAFPPSLVPTEWLFGNYARAWRATPFLRYFLNSGIMSIGTVVLELATATLAAYALARMRVPGRKVIFGIMLATLMIPPEAILIPNFIIIKTLNWYDTYWALIIPFAASVFAIFLLRQTFLNVPHELYESAVLDGCSHLRYLWQIVLPLSRSGLAVVALLTFIRTWNAFQWPLIVTGSNDMRPVQVGLLIFQSDVSTQYNLLMAGSAMAVAPLILLFFVAQRQLVQGIARTGLRG
jgi:multiple sugar transport system permease protein